MLDALEPDEAEMLVRLLKRVAESLDAERVTSGS
jgi:hypothetical protein